MTCKDCIHYAVCNFVNRGYGVPFATLTEHCGDFKDKSRLIELPCVVGDCVYWITQDKKNKKKSRIFFEMRE